MNHAAMFFRPEMQPSSCYPDQTQPLLGRFVGRSSADAERSPEDQYDLDPAWLRRFSFNQTCAALRKSTAQHMRDVNQERLPQTIHRSCGLSLTTSHSAHKTAFCRATAFNTLPRAVSSSRKASIRTSQEPDLPIYRPAQLNGLRYPAGNACLLQIYPSKGHRVCDKWQAYQ